MSLRNKIIGSFILLIMLSMFTGIYIVSNIKTVESNVEHLADIGFKGVSFLLEADRDSYQSNVALLQIITMNNQKQIQKVIDKGVNDNLLQVRQRFDKFKALLQSNLKNKKNEFNAFDVQYDLTKKDTQKLITLINQNKKTEALEYYNKTYLGDYEKMRDYLDLFTEAAYKSVDKNKNEVFELILHSLTVFVNIAIVTIVIAVALSVFMSRIISKSFTSFKDGLLEFFAYLNKEKENAALLDVTKDEFGQMAKVINENIEHTAMQQTQDDAIIQDTINTLAKINSGDYTARITLETVNKDLMKLKAELNTMGELLVKNVGKNIKPIQAVLEKALSFDFRESIGDAQGEIEVAINKLNETITKMLIENKSNGLVLNDGSTKLLDGIDRLNSSSTQVAASLEETAASLEEITSNIRSTTENIGKMSSYASSVTNSATEGENMANKTTVAMEEIDKQVNSINEAIAVIDQIAFQTNILSLNAAVEAATAGEAGKGFAVVAGEVRNLANRSAEAANEIKALVESATSKANNGKSIADEMISGYKELSHNIQNTLAIIKEVEEASKEQLVGIQQINDSVAQIDSQTQSNAAIANDTHTISDETNKIAAKIVEAVNEKEFVGKS